MTNDKAIEHIQQFWNQCNSWEIPDEEGKEACEMAIEALKGKPLDKVLNEIKKEFKRKRDGDNWYHTTDGFVWEEAMEIIDKHKAESEDKE